MLASRVLYCDSHCVVVNKIAGEATEGNRITAPRQGALTNKYDSLRRTINATVYNNSGLDLSGPARRGKTEKKSDMRELSVKKGIVYLPRLLAQHLIQLSAGPPLEDSLPLPVAVHRIDVPVSGCVLFARTKAALSFLTAAFRSGTVEKKYWAIAEASAQAEFTDEITELVHWIQFDSRKNKSIAHDEPKPGCKKALMRCRLVGRGQHYLFLEIELVSGRHHQIRAQLERLGIHIKGDLKYGAKRSEPGGGIRLHARSLTFPDPADNGKTITVQADPPLRDNLWLAFINSPL